MGSSLLIIVDPVFVVPPLPFLYEADVAGVFGGDIPILEPVLQIILEFFCK